MVSANRDGTIRFWNPRTAEPLADPVPVHEGRMGHVWSVAYSPDGARVVTGSRDATVAVLDATSGSAVRPPLVGHKGDVFCTIFSPDGATLATSGKDGWIRLWDGATGAPAGEIAAHEKSVYAIGFSPDGLSLASASEDGRAVLWRRRGLEPTAPWSAIRSLDVPVESLLRRPGARHAIAFSPDGTRLATASHASRICLWDARTGESIAAPLVGHTDVVLSLVFVDDNRLLSSSWDGAIRIWKRIQVSGGATHVSKVLGDNSARYYSIAHSPEGGVLASAGWDFALRLWDLSTERPMGTVQGRQFPVASAIAFSPDSKSLAVAYRTGALRLWDPATGTPCGPPLVGHVDAALMAAFSPDGRVLASSGFDHTIRLWSAESGLALGAPLEGHTDVVRSAVFSPDGKTLASASRDATVRLWDLANLGGTSSVMPSRVLRGHQDAVRCVAYSSDGRRLATASKDATLRLWDAITGEPITVADRRASPLRSLGGVQSGWETVASASDDGTVRLWDGETGESKGDPLLGHTDWVQCLAFSPDGSMLASASGHPGYERAVRLWDPHTGRALGQPLLGHEALITWVAFSPDGRWLASASQDGTVRIRNPRARDSSRALA